VAAARNAAASEMVMVRIGMVLRFEGLGHSAKSPWRRGSDGKRPWFDRAAAPLGVRR
jgi:hypothetical protein